MKSFKFVVFFVLVTALLGMPGVTYSFENLECPDPLQFNEAIQREVTSWRQDETDYLEDYRALQLNGEMNYSALEEVGDKVAAFVLNPRLILRISQAFHMADRIFEYRSMAASLFDTQMPPPQSLEEITTSLEREARTSELYLRIKNRMQDEPLKEETWKTFMRDRRETLELRKSSLLEKLNTCPGASSFIEAQGYKSGQDFLIHESSGIAIEFANRHFSSSIAH